MRPIPAGLSYDTALPQSWVDDVKAATGGLDPCGHMVWAYDAAGGLFGRPYPLDGLARMMIRAVNMKNGWDYPEYAEVRW